MIRPIKILCIVFLVCSTSCSVESSPIPTLPNSQVTISPSELAEKNDMIPSALSPTDRTRDQSVLTPTFPITKTPIHRATRKPTLPEKYTIHLSDGDYLLYGMDGGLGLISRDGKVQVNILKSSNQSIHLAPDRHHVILATQTTSTSMIDLRTMEQTKLPFLKDCDQITLSPDEQYFLASCRFKEFSQEIYLISRDGSTSVQITNCSELTGYCSIPKFSPDGMWMSYYFQAAGAIQTPGKGFYLVSTACLSSPEKCLNDVHGPINIPFDSMWSNDGKFLACQWNESIRIYSVQDGEITPIKDLADLRPSSDRSLVWSVDNLWITYKRKYESGALYEISIDGGQTRKMVLPKDSINTYLLGWVQVPNDIPNNLTIQR